MILKNYLKNNTLFSNDFVGRLTNFYNIDSIPTWANTNYRTTYESIIKLKMSNKELYYEDPDDIKEAVTLLFIQNFDKYKHTFDTLDLTYNPLWNVDATETTSREMTDERTNTLSGSNATTYNTTETTEYDNTHTYNTTETTDETEETTYNTTETITHNTTEANTGTNSRTTYDSNNFYDTDKEDSTRTNTGTDTTAKTGTETTDNDGTTAKTGTETDASEGTNRKTGTDSITHTANGSNDIEVNESITLERHGNIGVTSTIQLITEDIKFSSQYRKFLDMVCRDIVNEITLFC